MEFCAKLVEQPKNIVPAEFKLSAYEVCKGWGLPEWFSALSARYKHRRHWILACSEGNTVAIQMIEDAKKTAVQFFNNPMGNQFFTPTNDEWGTALRDQTVSDFFEGHSAFEDIKYKKWADCYQFSGFISDLDDFLVDANGNADIKSTEMAIRGAFDFPKIPAWKMHHELNELSNQYFISIDLGANDDLLVKEFKAWLKKIRQVAPVRELKTRVRFSEAQFRRWCKFSFLPYLDIVDWAKLHNVHLTESMIAKLIIDKDLDGEHIEILKKTVKSNALALVREEVLYAMSLHIADDVGGRHDIK